MIEKITATNEEIASALEEASVPTLMMSMIHITGDTSLLDGPIKPNTAMLNEAQGFMSEEDKAAIRAQALKAIIDYRDRGCLLDPPPDDKTIKRMLNFIVGEQKIGDDYVQMMMEEMSLSGKDERQVLIDKKAPEKAPHNFHATIVGGGMSGVLAGIRLKQAGLDFTILEKNSGPGGTWYENTYPGCRVDIASHFYSYSFEPNYPWTKYFAEQGELSDYFQRMVQKHDLASHIRYNTEVTEVRYHEEEKHWTVEYVQSAKTDTIDSHIVISAVGQLNRPKVPEIKGRDSFEGAQMHTAQWNAAVDFSDKRVAVVGTGASAFQLVPELAKQAKSLKVFQRSPPWMMPNAAYHQHLGKGKQWCLDYLPYYQKWFRFLIFWPGSDGGYEALRVDPSWEDNGESINELNKGFRDYLVDYMRSQVDDPELLAKVTPAYPPLGKRLLQDNGTWLKALQKDNVSLIDRAVECVEPTAIVDAKGERHEIDVIVWATGFHADRILWPLKVIGKNKLEITRHWGNSPEAYLGITMPHFPNFYCMYGPNTNLAHAGSLIFHSECQIRYIMQAIKMMLEDGVKSIECKPEVCAKYNKKLQDLIANLVWTYPKVTNWYQNSEGKVTTTSPWLLVDYWKWTRYFESQDYLLN